MSVGRSEHKVFLYKNDYNTMCTEVYRHQHIETGGNLFGLWTTSGNAVIHVVVGPGKDCKRTDVSFNQDIEYMKRVGEFLNKTFMLCHIGEWHSHHHLTLNKPSDGDRRTVRNNYPQGVKKFLVIIVNIEGTDRIVLSPYFFTDDGHTCLKAEFKVLDGDSPFTMDSTIARVLDIGSENQQSEPMDTTPTNNHQPTSRDGSRRNAVARQSSGGNSSPASADDSRRAGSLKNDRSSSSVDAVKTGSARDASARNSSTTPRGETPPPDYPGADPSRQQNGRNSTLSGQASDQGTSRVSPGPPSASQSPTTTKPSPPTRRNENQKQTRRDITIKKIYDWIRSNLRPQDIGMERNPSGDIEMKFKHKDKSWLITFPTIFPEGPAKMHCCRYNCIPKPSDNCHTHKPNSLNNYVDILLSIKRNCSFDCTDCKKMSVDSVTRADRPFPALFLTEKGNAMLEELNDSSFADPGSFETQIKYDVTLQDEATLEVSFKHSSKLWTVTLTSTFPFTLATINYKDMRYPGYYSLSNRSSTRKLDSASKILFAISQECRCEKCKDFVKNK